MNARQAENQLGLILAFANKIPIECKYKSDR